jgi:hypothetical protein
MKKILLIVMVVVATFSAKAQSIKVSESDKFLKKYRIETSMESMKLGSGNAYKFGFRSVDKTIFFVMFSYGEMAGVIGADSKIMFLLDNDSTISITSKGVQGYDPSGGANTATHEYYITESDINQLKEHKIKSMRKYLSDGYKDNDFKDSWSKAFNQLCVVFLNEYDSKVLTTTKDK